MITLYDAVNGCLSARGDSSTPSNATVWIDLFNPTTAEEADIETALGIDVPTRAEMREIEVSNRFYSEAGAHFMTAILLQITDQEAPTPSNVTFILAGNRLVTVRYSDPKAFGIFAGKACKGEPNCTSGAHVLIGLLETIVQRQADHIERIQDEVETLAPQIFGQKSSGGARVRRLDVSLRTLGRCGDLTSRGLESAVSLHRTLNYFSDAVRARDADAALLARIDSAGRDIASLIDHLKALVGRTAFLLEATLGSISNEQNQIIKLFSVMAVMLMPPTLVASVYGMNFNNMPELHWTYGYPMALGMMFVSALIPFIYFRHKGWL